MQLREGACEEELVRLAKAGDGAAFDDLLQPLLEPAFRLAMTMLRDRSAAEDAVQEAALKAWVKLDTFKFRSEAGLKPWFLTIVANQCRSVRRGRWWVVLKFGELVDRQEDPDLTARVDLQRALDRLPHSYLLILSLYYHLDLPIDEVAAALGISAGAAKARLHRARQALRPALTLETP